MKILQIGNTDKVGNRFNGHDLQKYYNSLGHEASHFVWIKETQDINTYEISGGNKTLANIFITFFNYRLSMQSLLYFGAFKIFFKKIFWKSDVVHSHIIHTGYFSLLFLPIISWLKPVVWTLHDPWPITGHCIYPMTCDKWMKGCGKCPDLSVPMALKHDTTKVMWHIKKFIFKISKFSIIVASQWMEEMIRKSPLLTNKNINVIPFGINHEVFKPIDKLICQNELGIIPGSFVICFRSNSGKFKGLNDIKYCLENLKTDRPVCLLTLNERGLIDSFRGKYQIVEMGWIHDEILTAKVYNACDIFFMPSTAEAFGMMAIEAMSCGKTVLSYEQTSLSEIINSPYSGAAVEYGNKALLLDKLNLLINNKEELDKIGSNAVLFAKKKYSFDLHQKKIMNIYESMIIK